jgi:hypothetical protein
MILLVILHRVNEKYKLIHGPDEGFIGQGLDYLGRRFLVGKAGFWDQNPRFPWYKRLLVPLRYKLVV